MTGVLGHIENGTIHLSEYNAGAARWGRGLRAVSALLTGVSAAQGARTMRAEVHCARAKLGVGVNAS